MNAASVLMTYGKSTGDISTYVLEGVKFIYLGKGWLIYIKSRRYEVSETLASQVAYALTVGADIDIIQESLTEDEVKATPPEQPHVAQNISFEEWTEQEFRKDMVRELLKKSKRKYNTEYVT